MTTILPTTWQPQQGDGEYSLISPDTIVDNSGALLVDSSANNVGTSDSMFTPINATVWSSNDGS